MKGVLVNYFVSNETKKNINYWKSWIVEDNIGSVVSAVPLDLEGRRAIDEYAFEDAKETINKELKLR